MKKNFVVFLVSFIGVFYLFSDLASSDGQRIASGGAPVSSTGAPSERNCTESDCHDTYPLNSGSAASSLQMEELGEGYEPGRTYRITVKVQDAGILRFGYQLTALYSETDSAAGFFTLIDEDRTQILTNDLWLRDRQYATYTYPGTAAKETGIGEWSVLWTAPNKAKGPVTIYGATISANNDNTDKGDWGYTFSKKIFPLQLTSSQDFAQENNIVVYPNPMGNFLHIDTKDNDVRKFSAELCDCSGSIVRQWSNIHDLRQADFSGLPSGHYILRGKCNGKYFSSKIVH